MTTYQDRWANGALVGKGYRECEERYRAVKEVCARFRGKFTVCDIGANMSYFGIRLTEDFPGCSVLAFEYDHFKLRAAHLKASGAERVMLLERRLSLEDVRLLGACSHFDVVLALSVLHHVTGTLPDWLLALRLLGDLVIAEFAGDDSARAVSRDRTEIPADATVIGRSKSHLRDGAERQMVTLPGLSRWAWVTR